MDEQKAKAPGWGAREKPCHVGVRWLFLRMLAAAYLAAFGSLWTQIIGLLGKDGILPAARYLEQARRQLGGAGWLELPTLFWWNISDAALWGACALGTGLSLLAMAGVAQGLAFAALWMLWLSLFGIGQEFPSFQWDLLLLEAGFLAIFFAPWKLRPGLAREDRPSRALLWLLRWLLFRLMFRSGVVKLASGDPAWWGLTALQVHYETQPLPTWIGWWAHQLPAPFQRASCAAMFGIELALPFLIVAPRKLRFVACGGFATLMVLISLTGNYCYFNWLTLALAVLLLDDRAVTRELPTKLLPSDVEENARAFEPGWKRAVNGAIAGLLVLISLGQLHVLFPVRLPSAAALAALERAVRPFCVFNHYGLFAVMTPERPEIQVEGSADGKTWLAYEFRYKAGDPMRAPGFVAPHQPRLDWQMWFAALGTYRENPWFMSFLERLLLGSREVRALLEKDPFPDAPPRYVRATLLDYRFTRLAERRATGAWWKRESKGLYCPAVSLGETTGGGL
ncbi:MAG: lipase maturation factor family protein [Candidatus Wallbacteria bacterium]|nr:lipase maturation factor family protein [Candidatus Wallbacteria bacterium]